MFKITVVLRYNKGSGGDFYDKTTKVQDISYRNLIKKLKTVFDKKILRKRFDPDTKLCLI